MNHCCKNIMDKCFCANFTSQPSSLRMHFSCWKLASLFFWPQNTRIISATHTFPKKIPHEFLRRPGHQKPLHQIRLNKLCPVTADQLGCAFFEKRPTFDFSRSRSGDLFEKQNSARRCDEKWERTARHNIQRAPLCSAGSITIEWNAIRCTEEK